MCGAWAPRLSAKRYTQISREGEFIQETRLAKGEAIQLQRRWRGQIYATEVSAFARGTLIWVKPGVPFEAINVRIDTEGRWVFVLGR